VTISLGMYFLSKAMRFLPVDITYASFAEVCILGTAFVRIFKFDQALSLISTLGLG
jgi:multidrug transporter EmrE-like cation transporter